MTVVLSHCHPKDLADIKDASLMGTFLNSLEMLPNYGSATSGMCPDANWWS